jgi:hypothetical protein
MPLLEIAERLGVLLTCKCRMAGVGVL